METTKAPDYLGPFLGYRLWRLGLDCRLWSLAILTAWPEHDPLIARHFAPIPVPRLLHPRAPLLNCICGIYSFSSREYLEAGRARLDREFPGPLVTGEVLLWGQTVETSHGYRSMYAHVHRLYDDPALPVEDVAARYHVEVVP